MVERLSAIFARLGICYDDAPIMKLLARIFALYALTAWPAYSQLPANREARESVNYETARLSKMRKQCELRSRLHWTDTWTNRLGNWPFRQPISFSGFRTLAHRRQNGPMCASSMMITTCMSASLF